MEMRFVCHEAEKRLKDECLNRKVCADRIVEVRCAFLPYKSPGLSEEDGEKGFLF